MTEPLTEVTPATGSPRSEPGSVIVGVGSGAAAGPLAWAATASTGGTTVVVVALGGETGTVSVGTEGPPRAATERAQAAVGELHRRGIEATTHLPHAEPAEALLALAGPQDLLVVGVAEPGPASRALHGRVVHQLLERATCPVAIVPDLWEEPSEGRPHIAVGWDGSRASHEALRWAATEAHRTDGQLVLVRAFDRKDHASASSRTADAMFDDARSVAAEHDVTDIRFAPIPLAIDGPARALDDAAAHADARVIVLGADHGRWLSTVTHSAVSERTAARGTCPVVVMPRR